MMIAEKINFSTKILKFEKQSAHFQKFEIAENLRVPRTHLVAV